jgi:hypothetical protein
MSKSKQPAARQTTPSWLLPALLLGIGAILVGLAVWVSQRGQQTPFTPQVTGRPAAEIDQDVFEYGDVRFNTPMETVFRVRNVGDQPLRILGEPRVELVEGC